LIFLLILHCVQIQRTEKQQMQWQEMENTYDSTPLGAQSQAFTLGGEGGI